MKKIRLTKKGYRSNNYLDAYADVFLSTTSNPTIHLDLYLIEDIIHSEDLNYFKALIIFNYIEKDSTDKFYVLPKSMIKTKNELS